MLSQSAFISCTTFFACIASTNVFAFSTDSRTIVDVPVANRREWHPKVEIELPNLATVFDRISMASPLAKLVMEGKSEDGFAAIDDDVKHPELKWKKVEENKRKTVHRIDKADQFQNVNVPLLRFRSSIKGPCIGERFSNFIMDLEERKKWDEQIAKVDEMYPIDDLDAINTLLGDREKYGSCARIGVGYSVTKQGIISPREQLICGGMQEFSNGATILWGTEMEDYHNHLLPEGPRHTRAKSHLFAATLAPTGPDSFDVEYLLQMDVGGGLPSFMTTPAVTDIVKKLFDHARDYFEGGEGSELDSYLKSRQQEKYEEEVDFFQFDSDHIAMNKLESLLFTP
jgi:hypothetical protein